MSRRIEFKPNLTYLDPDQGDGDGINPHEQMEVATARFVGEMLSRHYPGHPWHVEVDITRKGGVIKVRLSGVMPPDYWYKLDFNEVFHDVGGKRTVVKAGGELLERYQLPRARFDMDHWQRAMSAVPIHGRGNRAPLR